MPDQPLAVGSGEQGADVFGRGGQRTELRARVIPRWAWLIVVGIGAVFALAYYIPFLPSSAREIEYVGSEAVAVSIMFAALTWFPPPRRRAWILIGIGMTLLLLGDVVWDWLEFVMDEPPTPSFADVLYLAEYPFLFVGVTLLVRGRPDIVAVLDTAILSLGTGVLLWELGVRPYLVQSTLPPLELAVSVAYPIADMVLVGVVARLALTSGLASTAIRLVALGLVITLLSDVGYLILDIQGVTLDPSPLDYAYPLSLFLWAAAVLHPSARIEQSVGRMDWLQHRTWRVLLMCAAALLVPAAIMIDASRGDLADLPIVIAAWGVLVLLVVVRVEGVLMQAHRAEQRFHTVFEASPAGIGLAREGRVIEGNPAVQTIFGYPGDKGLVGLPLAKIVDASAMARFRARQQGAEGPNPPPFEAIGIKADGTRFPLLVDGRSIVLPDGPANIGFFLDLSEQRAAQETLRESERRYRELFEHNPHVMWVLDRETLRFLAVNELAVTRLGWSREEFATMTIEDLGPPTQSNAEPGIALAARSELDSAGPWRVVNKAGAVARVELTSRTISWQDRPAMLVLALDVTERIRLEEQLRQSQKMDAVGQLAGGVAHDFNNLLTAISGYAELLQFGLEVGDPRYGDAVEILRATGRASALTRQLLTFSRRQVLSPELLDVNQTIAGDASMIERLLGEDVELRLELAPDAGSIRADQGQIVQVLMNLSLNARDAMPDGGVLVIRTACVELTEQFASDHPGVRPGPGPHAMLIVSDTGTGMDAETLSHMFEPFFTTKPVGQGTGLGLATVYGIVKASGGQITVSSEPRKGTTVTVYLPSVEGVGQRPAAADESEALAGSETILIVEDETSVRRIARTLLERQGYKVLEAPRAEEGESIAASHPGPIELLVTDVIMPGRNGVEMAERIRAIRPDIRVLFMSGYTEDVVVRRGGSGGGGFIEKPFSHDEFLRAVRQALEPSASSLEPRA
jgi:PAS domain S-box-containing protein